MLNGDISADVEPTILLVCEGLVALPPTSRLLVRGGRGGKVARHVHLWTIDITVEAALWRVWQDGNRNIELVTFLDEGFRKAMAARLDAQHYPYRRIWSMPSREELTSALNHMPFISAVYHAEASRPFLFGGKGRLVTPDLRAQIGRF